MNNQSLKKLLAVARDIEKEKGTLTLIAVLKREAALDQWDLIIAAPWVTNANLSELRYVTDKMQKRLTKDEMISIAQVVLLRPEDQVVRQIIGQFHRVDQTSGVLPPTYLNGMLIERGYILSAQGEVPRLQEFY
jgi:hypothetical protein